MAEISWQPIGIAILIIATLVLALCEVGKRMYTAELARLLEAGDIAAFRKTLNLPLVRLIFPAWNRAFMELNACLRAEDTGGAYHAIEHLRTLKASKVQRADLCVKAFTFYVEQKDKQAAKEMLNEMPSVCDSDIVEENRRLYEIYLEGSSAYITPLKERLAQATGADKGFLELLIAVQYENRGDGKRAKAYMSRAEVDMQLPSQV